MDNKINNISFTGIRNISFFPFVARNSDGPSLNKSLTMVLSDDLKGNDLTEFREAVKKINKKRINFNNSVSGDILNVTGYEDRRGKMLFVNNCYIHENDSYLPMFSYIAKLTKKICAMNHKDMIVDNDYIDNIAGDVIIRDMKIPEDIKERCPLYACFNRDLVKLGAEDINNFIQSIMNNYFGIK